MQIATDSSDIENINKSPTQVFHSTKTNNHNHSVNNNNNTNNNNNNNNTSTTNSNNSINNNGKKIPSLFDLSIQTPKKTASQTTTQTTTAATNTMANNTNSQNINAANVKPKVKTSLPKTQSAQSLLQANPVNNNVQKPAKIDKLTQKIDTSTSGSDAKKLSSVSTNKTTLLKKVSNSNLSGQTTGKQQVQQKTTKTTKVVEQSTDEDENRYGILFKENNCLIELDFFSLFICFYANCYIRHL